jgi:phosphatidylserine decarboxylase
MTTRKEAMRTVLDSIARWIPPIHREGYLFIALFALATCLLFWLWSPLGLIGLFLTAWCAAFFRDPVRVVPLDPSLVLAPADGLVSSVGAAVPPMELGLGREPLQRVSIFMSVFDCHVNRVPVAGTVRRIIYTPGTFLNADLDKASEDNERNALIIETEDDRLYGIVQIAGLVARRIVSFVREEDTLGTGERFGLIRFGSRVDVYLPEGVTPLAAVGQRTVAGETPIAAVGGLPRRFRSV